MSSGIRSVGAMLIVLLWLLAPFAAAQEATGETAQYLMVLREASGAGGEPDVVTYGGKLLKSRMNRRLVSIPPAAAEQLARDPRVAYLQRMWDGNESVEPAAPSFVAPLTIGPTSETTLAWESRYTYDGSGNVATAGSTISGTEAYTYDLVGRLSSATVKGTTESYRYDSFGNLQRTGSDGAVGPAISSSTNQIVGRTYDAIGNQLTVKKGTVTATADFDALGMIVELPTINGSRRMIYTADDERIAVVVSNGIAADDRTEIRVRDLRGKVLTEWHKTAEGVEWIRDYVYAENRLVGGVRQAGTENPAPTRHYHLDHLGSIRRITRTDGVSVSEVDYFPFGTELTSAITEGTRPGGYTPLDPAKFTGHERDYLGLTNDPDGDVLDYMHARYYDGRVGRFLSVDAHLDIDSALKNPQEWNRYSYVTNNPLKYTDPDGKDKFAAFFLGAAGKDVDTLDVIFDRQTIEDVKQGARTFFAEHESMFRGLSPLPTTRTGAMMAVLLPGFGKYAGGAVAGVTDDVVGVGFKSFNAFKRAYGSAGQNQQWHHIVEQTAGNVAQFGQRAIHNTGNLIKVSTETHRKISGYYSSKQAFTGGLTVRQWLSKKSIKEQYEFGMQVLRNHGVIK